MYNKLHQKLTFLFTLVTGGILLVMSLLYLYLYQKDLTENSFLSFSTEVSSVISSLEEQKEFSLEWLAKTSANSHLLLAFYDRDTLLSSCRLALSEEEILLAEQIWRHAYSNYSFLRSPSTYSASHAEFQYKLSGNSAYYVSAICLSRYTGSFTGVILSDTSSLAGQITRQRIRFALLNVLGILCLLLFSWIYTGRLLSPIQVSFEKQNAFIAAASHELRTPLAVILSAASAFGQGTSKEKEKFLNIIEMESRRMSVLVNDLLMLSKADSHGFLLHPALVESDTLLLETFEAFEPLALERHMRLHVNLPDTKVKKCYCDKERIGQVLGILISNAVSYGGENGSITLNLKEERGRILLSVADNGPGIPDKDKSHIFDRFYRGDSSRSQKGHFGLGLCIAREIMDAHHGKIWVEDAPEGGAIFYLSLKSV